MQDHLPQRELHQRDKRRRGVAEQPAEPLPQDREPKAGFSDAELRAAARVIENEVQRVTARYAPKAG